MPRSLQAYLWDIVQTNVPRLRDEVTVLLREAARARELELFPCCYIQRRAARRSGSRPHEERVVG